MRRPSVIVAGVLAMGGWVVWLLNATFVIQGFLHVRPFEPAYLVVLAVVFLPALLAAVTPAASEAFGWPVRRTTLARAALALGVLGTVTMVGGGWLLFPGAGGYAYAARRSRHRAFATSSSSAQ